MPENRGRMLVVDDNRVNRMVLERALAQEGYIVATAENGRQALDRLAAEPFDVVLLDVVMPELDGYQTLAEIKSNPALRHIPVIMISAVEEMDSVVRCIEMGATDYLPKPFNSALLHARINASLAEKRLRDLEREYLEQVGYVADAAAAVRSATFDPASLDRVAERSDALGQLARVFQQMAREVQLREQRLKRQLEQMHSDVEDMRKALIEPLSVYLPMDRRQALVQGKSLPDRTRGTALFADISGFTALTAGLAQALGLQRGAEELTRLLNEVYGVLIAEVHGYGGSVIGFSGDAITCWFDGDDGLRATACALAMQGAMGRFRSGTVLAGVPVALDIKVAVAAGPVRRFLVGNPEIQVVEVIAGRTLNLLARAEGQAARGEVLVTAAVISQTGEALTVGEWRAEARAEAGEHFAVVKGMSSAVPRQPWPELPPASLPDSVCRPWLSPTVARRLSDRTKQFLAELRPAVALFLSFEGIDYDANDEAGQELDSFVRWAQAIVQRHEGTLIQLTIGDKGSYLYVAFGAPIAHPDDGRRAVEAALELMSVPTELPFITHVHIGVAKGRMRTGAYGSATQRTYGVLGDKANLAARLMQVAEKDILCDEDVHRDAQRFLSFEPLPPVRVKGRTEPVVVHSPTGEPADNGHAQAAIQARLDTLPFCEQLTLKIASVIGDSFSEQAIVALLPLESEKPRAAQHLAGLAQAGLIEQTSPGPVYAFQDPKVRQVVYEAMLFAQRRRLHRQVAEWVEHTFGDNLAPHYAMLAHHWQKAEEASRAIEYLEKAGRHALAVNDYEAAEVYFQQSLDLEAQAAVLSSSFYEQPGADYDAALHYALERLEKELDPTLSYHNLWHTRDEVLPVVQCLSAMLGVGEEDTRLLETAAAYHDIGFTIQGQEHERLGCEIAAEVLPGFGFSPAQIATIQAMIMATELPQSPNTPLEEILADAELDVLGREDFWARNKDLRRELAAKGVEMSEEGWYASQLKLLETHHYWTAAAHALRSEAKQKNAEALRQLLAESSARGRD